MRNWQMAGPAAWEQRLRPMVTVVPYVLLAVLAGLTIALKRDTPGSLAIDLALCAAAALWTLVMFTLRQTSASRASARRASASRASASRASASRAKPDQRGAIPQVFLAGLILFALVMVIRLPWFGFYTPALYFYAYRIIGWPRELIFVAATAVVAGTAQGTGLPFDTWTGIGERAAVVLANVAPMCLLAWIGQIAESYYRALTAAQHDNAALARQAGVLDERARLAREIHDTLAQGLTGIITQLQAAEDAADWRRHHDAAKALARESLAEARRSVDELRPEPLETGRLADAITQVAAAWSARQRIPARVTVTGAARDLGPRAEVALLRTAQEALANVAKHAGSPTRVGVTLSYMDNETALDVRDDGRGFDPATVHGGFGLEAMRQRIEALAGSLQIETEIDGGTGISACVPVERPAH